MVRMVRLFAAIVLIVSIVPLSCSGGDIDPDVTTYTTVEERSSQIGSEGGEVQLEDESKVLIPENTLEEGVVFTFGRKSAQGELPRSIAEDPDSTLISDFYFVHVDRVMDRRGGISLEFSFGSSTPADQVRVIEVFNIEDETHVRFVDAFVDETSRTVLVPDVDFCPTEAAIQDYETEHPPTDDIRFYGMGISVGYAVVADATLTSWAFAQPLSEILGATCSCSVKWGRIRCVGERAEVSVARAYGTGDAMKAYACSALLFADSIQNAYSSAGFETHDKIIALVTEIDWLGDGATIPGMNRLVIRRDLGTEKGGDLNLTINHETVHTMQHTRVVLAPWWKESSADWIAYYFEPDEVARQMLRNKSVLFVNSGPRNPFRDSFPPWWGDEVYDFSVLIDYVVETGLRPSELMVDFINVGGDPTEVFAAHYRDSADGFAQYLAEEGYLKSIAQSSSADGEFDSRSSGSVVLSIEVAPLTLPVKRYSAEVVTGMGHVTFRVTLEEVTNDGGIVIGTTNKGFEGLVDENVTLLSTTKGIDIYLMPFAKGSLSAEIKVLVEWEPWTPDEEPVEYELTVSSSAGGSVTTPGEGTFIYDEGTVVNLVAEAEEGYQFVNWTGDVGTVDNVNAASTTITMEGNYSVTASFEEESEEEPVYFPDANLEAAIREAIDKPTGEIYPSDLEELTSLDASAMIIEDLTGLEYCTNLTWLDLYGNIVLSDISPLANLTNLTYLDLENNEICDISPLTNLSNLTALWLAGNQISDISPLANLTSLSYLNLSFNQISNISTLAKLTSLTDLRLSWNQIWDISSLANLTNLTGLSLAENQIGDIIPLANLGSLTSLGLYGNQISDISPLANLTNLTLLSLHDNQISDVSPLVDNTGLGEGDTVYLGNNPLSEDSINIYIPELEARGVNVDY